MPGYGVEGKSGCAFLAPFVGYRVDGFVHFTKDGLFLRGQKDVCGVVYFEVGSEHPFAGYFKADPFEMGHLFGSGKGQGKLDELRAGNHDLIVDLLVSIPKDTCKNNLIFLRVRR
jgi:hypothetical protein